LAWKQTRRHARHGGVHVTAFPRLLKQPSQVGLSAQKSRDVELIVFGL
jgi:hypothetical protein